MTEKRKTRGTNSTQEYDYGRAVYNATYSRYFNSENMDPIGFVATTIGAVTLLRKRNTRNPDIVYTGNIVFIDGAYFLPEK